MVRPAFPCGHPLVALLHDDASTSERCAGVLDLRRGDDQCAYIRGALRVLEGMNGLDQRYSWLPPPVRSSKRACSISRRLVVLCNEEERAWVQRKLCGVWDVAGILTSSDAVDYASFWSAARSAGLVEEPGRPRAPAELLFEPSAMARLVVSQVEPRKGPTTLLDLGCGAGRDMAWIARQTDNGNTWRVSGVDNVQSIVRRAGLLAEEMQIGATQVSSSMSAIEAIVWARATSDGALELLPPSDNTAKTRAAHLPAERLSAFAQNHLPHATYDVLLLVRFWPPALLNNLPVLTHIGSLIAISHFTTVVESDDLRDADDFEAHYDSPASDKRFHAAQVRKLIDVWQRDSSAQWSVVQHFVQPCEDGRPLRNVVIRRDA